MPEPHIAIVLAAGASSRLGRPKQLLEIDGETLLVRAVRAAMATQPGQVVVALGAEIDGCRRALAGIPVRVLEIESWALGMGSTLAASVAAIEDRCCGMLVLGVDQPALDAAYLQRLTKCWAKTPGLAVATAYAGIVGVPAIFPAHWREQLMALSGDRGARQLLRAAGANLLTVDAPQLALDIDTADDWQRFTESG